MNKLEISQAMGRGRELQEERQSGQKTGNTRAESVRESGKYQDQRERQGSKNDGPWKSS